MQPPRVGEGDVVVGRWRYLLLQEIGRGGSAAVFRARRLPGGPAHPPPVMVAVKILAPDGARTELSALRALQSPRVVRCYDAALVPDPFIVLHLHTAGTLQHRIARGPMDEPGVWSLLRDMLLGLQDVHGASLLHLDMKPTNIFADGTGGWVLGDFGIAHPIHGSLAPLGFGTVGYQATEQRARPAGRVDMRTDLFGAGATAWSAWTGVNLARRAAAAYRQVPEDATSALPLPSSVRPGCSAELDAVIERLVAVEPARRPGSVAEALGWLRRVEDPGGAAVNLPGHRLGADEARAVVDDLVDPLLAEIDTLHLQIHRIPAGERLCAVGEPSYCVFVLMRGSVLVERDGHPPIVEAREGTFLGEVAALTGQPRSAGLRAVEDVYVRVLDASQFEDVLVAEPGLALRLIRTMAHRLSRS